MSSLIQAVPTSSCNGLELSLPRSLQSSLEEQVCLIATVRLVTPQFLKVSPEKVDYCEPVCPGCMWHHDFQQSKQHEEGQMPKCLNSNWLYHHHYASDLNSGKWIVTWRFAGMSRCKFYDFRMSYGWMFVFCICICICICPFSAIKMCWSSAGRKKKKKQIYWTGFNSPLCLFQCVKDTDYNDLPDGISLTV